MPHGFDLILSDKECQIPFHAIDEQPFVRVIIFIWNISW